MQSTAKNIKNRAIVVGNYFTTSLHDLINSTNDIACFLSSTSESDYIDSKSKVTIKRIKDQVSNQIHAISDGLRTCVANFSTE
jgi:hypothetical protein